MLLIEIAQLDPLFDERQEAAFRLYLLDEDVRRHADETLLCQHRESLAVLALEKPVRMGIPSCRRCLRDRKHRFCRALDALARGCPKPIKIPFFPTSFTLIENAASAL